ncbi:tetratricopeptide repeat protein [Chromobacterium subtsugae]|uniref:tetratricopeptide repeat protein n=1 Tax=Chromobacterium subtsugae TaxID=251747 RepID=UPI0007F93105|nr:SEL1-like repeat protein [Chromobacterium subtsugae]OBU87940.1 hypothetical protein MY55_03975 [Chromobacterium subtsugae]
MNPSAFSKTLSQALRPAALLLALACAPALSAHAETPAAGQSQPLAPQASAKPMGDQAYQLMQAGQQVKAHELFMRAAEMGDRRSLSLLADSYGRNPNGYLKSPAVKKDYPKLIQLLERAARYPEPEGSGYRLKQDFARLLITAPAPYRDAPRGSRLLVAATGQDDDGTENYYLLGQMYERGEGVPADGKQAVYWYERAASALSGYTPPKVQRALARIYKTGAPNLPADPKKSREWSDKAKHNPGFQS